MPPPSGAEVSSFPRQRFSAKFWMIDREQIL